MKPDIHAVESTFNRIKDAISLVGDNTVIRANTEVRFILAEVRCYCTSALNADDKTRAMAAKQLLLALDHRYVTEE